MFSLAINKFLSLGIVFGIIFTTFLFSSHPTSHAQALLYATFLLGYGHYLISTLYQLQGPVSRKEFKYIFYFIIVGLLSVGLATLAIYHNQTPLLAVIAIFIFIAHGAFNEQTHILRLAHIYIPTHYWVGMTAFLCLLTMFSLPHPSFFFTSQITFLELDFFQAAELLNTIIPSSFFFLLQVAAFFVCVFCLILPLYKWYVTSAIAVSLLCLFTILSVWLVSPIHYVYLFTLFLSYHFITWIIFGYQNLSARNDTAKIRQYVLLNIVIYGGTGLLFMLSFLETSNLTTTIFQSEIFLIFTYFHIITSFLNESWLKKILSI